MKIWVGLKDVAVEIGAASVYKTERQIALIFVSGDVGHDEFLMLRAFSSFRKDSALWADDPAASEEVQVSVSTGHVRHHQVNGVVDGTRCGRVRMQV